MTINIRRRRDRKFSGRLRCWFNGLEVTDRCFYADTRRGMVKLYALNSDGDMFIKEGYAAWIERRGRVVLRKKAA